MATGSLASGNGWVTAVQVLARQIIGRFKLGKGHTKIRERVCQTKSSIMSKNGQGQVGQKVFLSQSKGVVVSAKVATRNGQG